MKTMMVGVLMIVAAATTGCFGGSSGGSDDPVTPRDDSGITILDAGNPDRKVVDPVPTDAGTVTPDSGQGWLPTDRCAAAMEPFPTAAAGRCQDATRTCIDGCANSTCLQDCLAADTTAPMTDPSGTSVDCDFCINYVMMQCVDAGGCHDKWAALSCCIDNNCPADGACAQTTCRTDLMALQQCAQSQATGCLMPTSATFDVCYGGA